MLAELVVASLIVAVLTAVARPIYLGHRRAVHDLAARTDLTNALGVLEMCNAAGASFPSFPMTVTGVEPGVPCPGQLLYVSSGTTLTYRPVAGGLSYVLLADNSGGRPTYYCYDAEGSVGSISTVGSTDTSC